MNPWTNTKTKPPKYPRAMNPDNIADATQQEIQKAWGLEFDEKKKINLPAIEAEIGESTGSQRPPIFPLVRGRRGAQFILANRRPHRTQSNTQILRIRIPKNQTPHSRFKQRSTQLRTEHTLN